MDSLSARRWRRFLHRAGAVLFGLCLTVLLIEGGLRVGGYWVRRQPYRGAPTDPGADVVIVCVGDSHTQGIGAPPGMDYPSQLGALLNASDPEKSVQVINLGRSGDNSSQAAKRLLGYLEGAARPPDLVIFCAGANNDHNLSEATFLPREIAQMGLSLRLNHLLSESRSYRLSQNTVKRVRGLLRSNKNEAALRFDDLLNVREAEELRLLEEWIYRDIESVRNASMSRGAGLMLMNYFHSTAQVDRTYARAAGELGVPFLDVRNFGDPAYRFLLNRRAWVAPNFHPNQYGYARIAERVSAFFRDRRLLEALPAGAPGGSGPADIPPAVPRAGGDTGPEAAE